MMRLAMMRFVLGGREVPVAMRRKEDAGASEMSSGDVVVRWK